MGAADQPGVPATVLERLAKAGLSLKENYASIPVEEDSVLIVLAVSDVQEHSSSSLDWKNNLSSRSDRTEMNSNLSKLCW